MAFDPSTTPKLSYPKSHHQRRSPCLSLSAISAAIVILYIIFSLRISTPPLRFGIIIDAGSSGTRIHVYGYKIGKDMALEIDFGAGGDMKVSPGLSAYAEEPGKAGKSVVELVEYGKRRVPRDLWEKTEVRLMATAGLRMLEDVAKERILEACRSVLRGSGFLFRDNWATVIPGSDEGIYAWVAANYALGTLGGDPSNTTGIIELGGASAQVTFVSSEHLPPEFSHALTYGGKLYNLYSHSFLHFGQNVAHESLNELLTSGELKSAVKPVGDGIYIDPCAPKGCSHKLKLEHTADDTFPKTKDDPVCHAVGNFSECRTAAMMLLHKEKGANKCLYQECRLGSAYVPKLQGRFLATENFFYTSKFFGLGSMPLLSDLILAGKKFCEEDLVKLKRDYHMLPEEDFPRYCFSSAYIVALLHDSLGIALDDNRIGFANQVGNTPLDWALGAFVMQIEQTRISARSGWINPVPTNDILALVILLVLSALLVFAAWTVSKWRKPQMKTIYDLEKGRYIVSRINR